MLDFLLDNSVILVLITTLVLIGRNEYNKLLERRNIDPRYLWTVFKIRLEQLASRLFSKLATALIVAIIISAISFREIFMFDVFHTVFLTLLLQKYVRKALTKLFE